MCDRLMPSAKYELVLVALLIKHMILSKPKLEIRKQYLLFQRTNMLQHCHLI